MMGIKRIILEGADQQGKSKLGKILSERLGWEVVHFGPPPPDFRFHSGYKFGENTISDRNFLSEVAYSKMKGEESRVVEPRKLAQWFQCNGTLLILCDREHNFKFDADREELYSLSQINKVREIYRDEVMKMPMFCTVVDVDNDKGLIEKIIEVCK